MLSKAVLLILAAAATLALSAVAVEAVQSLRATTIATNNNSDSFLNHILRRLVNFDKDQYQYRLQEGLKRRTGFSLGRSFISTDHDDNNKVKYMGDTLDNRDLRADNFTRNKLPEYTFTPCADEYECDSTIVTYTREEVYIKVSSELKQSTNVQYCLTADPMITTDMYGSCGVQEDCACAYCIFGSWCVFQVCDSQCYELSGVDTE